MKRGTSVHRVLEEQIHTVVPVDVKTKEDRWGLKLFNMYQGLSCLEHEGLTREFPVFGFINDILVRGIIDEIIYQDPAIKTKGSETTNEEGVYKKIRRNSKADREQTPEVYNVPSAGKRQVYISDAKSRGTRSLPTSSQAKATALQLMAYHRLLEQMRSGQTDFARLLKHYSLDGEAKFSDSLIADIAGVNPDMPIELLLDHNSLLGMWELMRQQMTVSIDSMGDNMGISYRDQTEGRIFAYQTIPYDSARLDAHLDSVLSWWRGERATVGVEIEEAWKCTHIPFLALRKLNINMQQVQAASSRQIAHGGWGNFQSSGKANGKALRRILGRNQCDSTKGYETLKRNPGWRIIVARLYIFVHEFLKTILAMRKRNSRLQSTGVVRVARRWPVSLGEQGLEYLGEFMGIILCWIQRVVYEPSWRITIRCHGL